MTDLQERLLAWALVVAACSIAVLFSGLVIAIGLTALGVIDSGWMNRTTTVVLP